MPVWTQILADYSAVKAQIWEKAPCCQKCIVLWSQAICLRFWVNSPKLEQLQFPISLDQLIGKSSFAEAKRLKEHRLFSASYSHEHKYWPTFVLLVWKEEAISIITVRSWAVSSGSRHFHFPWRKTFLMLDYLPCLGSLQRGLLQSPCPMRPQGDTWCFDCVCCIFHLQNKDAMFFLVKLLLSTDSSVLPAQSKAASGQQDYAFKVVGSNIRR